MLSAVDFWMERLVKGRDGSLECPHSWSPEHGPDDTVTAHAQQLVWMLFANTLDAIQVIGLKSAGLTAARLKDIKDTFSRLDNGLHNEVYPGNYGDERFGVRKGDSILREWKYFDYADGNGNEPDHRHLSHLMCLYPLSQVNPSSPYFTSVVNSLRLRGLQSQG